MVLLNKVWEAGGVWSRFEQTRVVNMRADVEIWTTHQRYVLVIKLTTLM